MDINVDIKVVLLGLGVMGRNHLRVLTMLKGVNLVGIYDTDDSLLKKLSSDYNVPSITNIERSLEEADAVVIATPTNTHYHLFKLCSKYVKNIFIEKPIAESYEEALEIKNIANNNNIFVQCGFIERFNPVVLELKNIISSENTINADFTRTNKLSNRITDVDVVLDLMIHDIDLALYFNGEIIKIAAFGKIENNQIAFASAILHHTNGALSRIVASRMTEKKMRYIHVTTDNLFIDAELLRKEILIHKQTSISQENGSSYVISSIEQQIEVKQQEALLSELQAFINASKGIIGNNIPGEDAALNSLKVCEDIIKEIKNA